MCGQCGKRFYMLRNGLMEHVFCQEVGVAPMECTPAARFHGTAVCLRALEVPFPFDFLSSTPPLLCSLLKQTVLNYAFYSSQSSIYSFAL